MQLGPLTLTKSQSINWKKKFLTLLHVFFNLPYHAACASSYLPIFGGTYFIFNSNIHTILMDGITLLFIFDRTVESEVCNRLTLLNPGRVDLTLSKLKPL